ncbi:hypothetical protein [Streptomyces sp. NPDC094032]|uniref:hypothetical protein n=1 Tax=Streptomyces sp. NPDC094032 TaxID=3155308 RepID=UPI00332A6896
MSDAFRFRAHPEFGFVASATAGLPEHLAHWLLACEQFLPLTACPGLYGLSDPDRDGARRTRQAVSDLRRMGYPVHADHLLDPDRCPSEPPARQEPVPHAVPAPV